MQPTDRHIPTSANAIPVDRRKASGEGKIGGPCHETKADGYFCSERAVAVVDGHGWCARHRPDR